jgi:hypothetical protein
MTPAEVYELEVDEYEAFVDYMKAEARELRKAQARRR